MSTLNYLTPAEKAAYLADGYLILPDFVSSAACNALIQQAKNLILAADLAAIRTAFSTINHQHAKQAYFLNSGDQIHFFFEEEALTATGELCVNKELAINKMGHALHRLDPVFHEFCHQAQLSVLMQDLGVEDAQLLQSMYICKQPYIGGEVTCHQDSTFLYTDDQSVVGLWFALEDATIENGCLWGIPGGHQTPLKSRMLREGDDTEMVVMDPTPWPLEQLVPLEVKKGSLIVLHGLFPHMSYKNTSPRSRHAFTLHMMPARAKYCAKNWLRSESFDKLCVN